MNSVRQRRERSGWQANLRGNLIYGANGIDRLRDTEYALRKPVLMGGLASGAVFS